MFRGRGERHYRWCLTCFLWIALAASCSRTPSAPEDDLYRAAELSFRHGDLEGTLAQIRARTPAWEDAPDSFWHWNYRILEAETLISLQRAPETLKLLEGPLPDRPELSTLKARWKAAQAYALYRTGKVPEAQQLLDESQRLAEAAGQVILVSRVEAIRGEVFLAQGRYEEAEPVLRSALDHATSQNDYYYQAAALNNLGMSRIRTNRYDAAIPLLERALTAADKAGALRIASAASTNLGLCANRLGDFDAALAHYEKAIEIQRKQDAKLFLQASLGGMGNIRMQQNAPKNAIPLYQQALDLARQLNATADASRWSGNLATAFIQLQDWNQAQTYNDEAIALKQRNQDSSTLNYPRLNAAEIAAGRSMVEQARELYDETIQSAGSDTFVLWEAHAGLGRLFRRAGDAAKAQTHFEAAIRWIEETRSGLDASNFKITLLARLIGFYQEYVDALVDQKATDKALQIVESSRARVLSERLSLQAPARVQTTSFADYERSARQSGAVLLSYWLAPKRSFLWVVTPRSKGFFVLPPQAEIDALVESHQTFTQNLRDPLTASPIAADRLYTALLAPARELIPQGSKVIIVPDGSLHSLNFETLMVPGEPRHYWIEDVTVSVATSLTRQVIAAPRRPQSLLLIGDADGVAEFPRLPSAAREIQSIQERIGPIRTTVHRGSDARPSVYRASNPADFSIIHFAAHASANRASPLDSAIILSPDPHSLSAYKLYARDLVDLPLNADLVTISGCHSAGARIYSGEGLVGFTWAFLRAGARNVIAGLWDVNDASTADLMDQLYKGIQAGQAPETALRAAKLASIHSGGNTRKPYYWAPFQVYVR